ncbi:MAG: hypothetical protein K0R39_2368 [Symbiobacteriaceae bacterium]|jgi:Tfp pilus assembly protein PilN|nr:hypothetical protein [Symbiobacteriaceae bacterium]
MTVRINFLPKQYQPPKQLGPKEWAIAAATALALVATGGYYASVYAGTADLERQVQADQAKHQSVKTLLVQADEIKVREAQVAKAEVDLRSLTGRQWSGVLFTLTQLTPQHVTWTNLKVEGSQVSLKGTGRSLIDIAQLLGGLVTDTSVEQVSLKMVNEKGMPVVVTVQAPEPDANGKSKDAVAEATKALSTLELGPVELGVIRQLEFDMVIILAPAEGRTIQHGT